jgi:hypothetical protein
LHACLKYDGPLHWHLADDLSPPEYLPALFKEFPDLHFTMTQTARQGWGANVNKALRYLHARTPFVYLNEDDYVPTTTLDLTAGVRLMLERPISLVRYDGISGHLGLNLWLRELQRSDGPTIDYMEIDTERSQHLNVYSNRPHLRHQRLVEQIGYYPEGRVLGATEEAYAHRVKGARPSPGVAVLANGIRRAFSHIGKTRQGTPDDVGT